MAEFWSRVQKELIGDGERGEGNKVQSFREEALLQHNLQTNLNHGNGTSQDTKWIIIFVCVLGRTVLKSF